MGYKDPNKQREYQRKWIAGRRAEFFKDKSCVRCGSVERLELDHKDSSTKIHHAIWSWSKERQKAEIAKCQILCHPCHYDKTLEAGEYLSGEDQPMSKLRELDVKYIFALSESGLSQRKIAVEFGINQTAVGKVLRREVRQHVEIERQGAL